MKLKFTKQLMEEKFKNGDFDSYAVAVGVNGTDELITSSNVTKDTYFDPPRISSH